MMKSSSLTHQCGYILLPVVLLISLVAVSAYMLNNESVLETRVTHASVDVVNAEYVASAGLQHTRWQLRQAGCGPFTDINSQTFGNNNYSSQITTNNVGGNVSSITVPVIADTFIQKDNSTANYGNNDELLSGGSYLGSGYERAMYRFDIENSGIASGATIVSAVARFYVISFNHSSSVTLHQVTADWDEATVNWDNIANDINITPSGSISSGTPSGQYVEVNITSLVQSWINGAVENYGLTIAPSLFNGSATSRYTSKEYGNSSQRPELIIKVSDGSISNRAAITATGSLTDGFTHTITQTNIPLYQPSSSTTLQPDATLGEDAEIWQQSPNSNYGNAKETWVSSASNDTTRTLLRFNVSTIPAGAKILNATLSLYRQSGSGADQLISAHRIMNSWKEDSVTWNERESGISWDTPGVDYDATVEATTAVGPSNQRYEWDLTTLAQGWVDGRFQNQGVVLVAAVSGLSGEQFRTSDDNNSADWPSLTIHYACECGVVCLSPQGNGNILLVVGDDINLNAADVKKQTLFEDWGYTVNLIDDDQTQSNFDSEVSLNDVVYVSESTDSTVLGTKLSNTTKGVVTEESGLLDELGLSSDGSRIVDSGLEIIDNSHYITALFPSGVLPIYQGFMEGIQLTGSYASGLQNLGNQTGSSSLALLETGATQIDGGAVPGRRVTVPVGRTHHFNWDYLNNNGRLIIQRAIQWGTGNAGGSCVAGNVRDEFNNVAFNNSDGSLNWASDWIDTDIVLGPVFGKAQIMSGEIRMQGDLVSANPSMTRAVDLSEHLSATLSFDFQTDSGVEAGVDSLVVEVSGDGGANWTVLEDFINVGPNANSSRSYDISSYMAYNTRIRFRINSDYAGLNDYFFIDNVDIAAACTAPSLSTPIAHWKLDDANGATAVDSEGGHDGALTGGPVWVVGQDGGALDFDGINDHVIVTHNDALSLSDTMSFSAWINPDAIGVNYKTVLTKDGGGSGSNYYFGLWQDELVFGFFSGGAFREVFTNGLGIQAGSWQQIAASFDNASKEVMLYLDGTLVHKGIINFSPTAVTADLTIGISPDGEYWRGLLDDVRIYNSVLSASVVSDLYASTGGGGGGSKPVDPPTGGVNFEAYADVKRTSNGKSFDIPKPANTAERDLLIATVVTDDKQAKSISPPAGWNLINFGISSDEVSMGVWWKLAGASEPAQYRFNWDEDQEAYGYIMRFTGHDPDNPINVFTSTGGKSSSPTNPAVVTTVDNAMILRIGGFDDDDISVGDPGLSGHTVITMDKSSSGSGTTSGGAGYLIQASAGNSGTSNFSLTKSEQYRAVTIGIAPAP